MIVTRLASVVLAVAAATVAAAESITIWLGDDTAAKTISPVSATVHDDGGVNVFWNTKTDNAYTICMQEGCGSGCIGGDVRKPDGFGQRLEVGVYHYWTDLGGVSVTVIYAQLAVIKAHPAAIKVDLAVINVHLIVIIAHLTFIVLIVIIVQYPIARPNASTVSNGAIAGGIVGAVAALGIMAAAVAIYVRQKRRNTASKGSARGSAMAVSNVELAPGPKDGGTGLEVSIPYKPLSAGGVAGLEVSTPCEPLPAGGVDELKASIPYEPLPAAGVTELKASIPSEPLPAGGGTELKASIPYEPLPPGSVAELKASIPYDPAAADVKPSPPRRAASLAVESAREIVADLKAAIPYEPLSNNRVAELKASLLYDRTADVKPSPPRRAASLIVESTRELVAATARLSMIEESLSRPLDGGRGVDVCVTREADPSTTVLRTVVPPSIVGGPRISASLENSAPPSRSGGMASTPDDAVATPEVRRWSTQEVARWLEDRLQLRPAIVNAFKGSNVDGARLWTLTDEELSVEMGLSDEAKLMFRAALERLPGGSARDESEVAPPPYHSRLPSA
ncbi:hypothetical protein HK101_000994 [Irineochytrium annulatum]|nr:hypothetical protein HK101_000994 [Irineochytrium annulatum]